VDKGSNIVVKDGKGSVIATTALPSGTLGTGRFKPCLFSFTISDLPDADFYVVTIGRRGGPTFKHSELKAANWSMDMTLGG
jgi:hypothetical protein